MANATPGVVMRTSQEGSEIVPVKHSPHQRACFFSRTTNANFSRENSREENDPREPDDRL